MVALREQIWVIDEVISISLAACMLDPLLNLFVVEIRHVKPIHYVVKDGPREENRLLLYDTNLVVVPLGVKVA